LVHDETPSPIAEGEPVTWAAFGHAVSEKMGSGFKPKIPERSEAR
jgi:hypothetical protein